MSEEILKALMQLFAIVTKQDEGVSSRERDFVKKFLNQQLNPELVYEYLILFDEYLDSSQDIHNDGGTTVKKARKLTSVKDSVRTLSICKKINKTLHQKQKIIVLIRLYELVNVEKTYHGETGQRGEIVETVASVFNISAHERLNIKAFVEEEHIPNLMASPDFLIVGSRFDFIAPGAKLIESELDRYIGILHVSSVDMYFLKYTGKNTVLLNGLPINTNQVYLFAYGSTLKLPKGDPVYFSDINAKFLSDLKIQPLSFNATRIYYTFPNGTPGVRDVNIAEGAGKLTAIMGSSGSGKTTLLNVLAGLSTPSQGRVSINGVDIHHQRDKIEGVIGFVAQDDILFEKLTVYQNLYYNARLCFAHLSDDAIHDKVINTLKSLGLKQIKDIVVGDVLNKKISGGQRKRLNIALELIREPAVLFLDEPTSGLSSRDSENVMDLLKELALKGKLIFVVIHQPSSEIYKMFDNVLILDVGGYPIYYGNPVEAVIYFKRITNQINADEGQCARCGNVNPEQVFNTIEAQVVDEYGNNTDIRKNSPKNWYRYFKDHKRIEPIDEVKEPPPKTLKLPSWLEQLRVFSIRDFLSKISNRQYMLINLLEAPVLALVLSFIIRYVQNPLADNYFFGNNENIPAYIFMSIIVAIFMGLTVSAEEIIGDAIIRKREAFLNLSKSAYLFSKICILFLLSAVQTISFVLIGNYILEIKGMMLEYWLVLFSVSCFANMLGLNISSTFNSAVTIYILIPVLLIPQMILSGAVFSFDKLNSSISSKDKVPFIADLMASRWAYEALAVYQFRSNKFEKYFYDYDRQMSQAGFMQNYWAPEMKTIIRKAEKLKQNNAEGTAGLEKKLNLLNTEFQKVQYMLDDDQLSFSKEDVNKVLKNFKKEKNMTIRKYVDEVKQIYRQKFVKAEKNKDQRISLFMKSEKTKTLYENTRRQYHNKSLADMVRKLDVDHRIMQYDGELIQKIDPVFHAPLLKGRHWMDYRTHFYAPEKHFAGKHFRTIRFNLAVIWVMTVLLYGTLYGNIFKKIITLSSKISKKNNMQEGDAD